MGKRDRKVVSARVMDKSKGQAESERNLGKMDMERKEGESIFLSHNDFSVLVPEYRLAERPGLYYHA